MKQIYDRTALLIGQQGLDCLRQSHVLVAGVGGVGSFAVEALTYSPIKGPEGNIEYLVHICKGGRKEENIDVNEVVSAAHGELD